MIKLANNKQYQEIWNAVYASAFVASRLAHVDAVDVADEAVLFLEKFRFEKDSAAGILVVEPNDFFQKT